MSPGRQRVPSLGALLAGSVLLLIGCGGSSGSSSTAPPVVSEAVTATDASGPTTTSKPAVLKVRLAEIRTAIEQVEAKLGGRQTYSEVNATQAEVNVFVIAGGQDNAYVVRDGVVGPAESLGAYTGRTFTADEVKFVPGVLDKVLATIRDAEVVAFSVTPNEKSGVDYIATVTAPNGEFRVLLGADGSIIATS